MNESSDDSLMSRRENSYARIVAKNFSFPDPNDSEFVSNLGEILEHSTDVDEEVADESLRKQGVCFKLPMPKKYIGLHSFSRRLYRDVPDLFDVLKKLFFKMQYYVDRLNPELIEIIDQIHMEKRHQEETLEKQRSKIWLRYRLTHDLTEPPEYTFHEISLAKIDLFLESTKSQSATNEITWFKWVPDANSNGAAHITFLNNNNNIIDLKYHIADHENLLKHYVLDEDVINYMKLLRFSFENFLESNYIEMNEINRDNQFFQLTSKNPIRFSMLDSYHNYSILDVFKVYFDFLIRSVEGSANTLQIMILNDEDYPLYHNTIVHKAIDIAGLELISQRDFNQRNLYDFIQNVQFQLNIACEDLFNDKPHNNYALNRHIIKSLGIDELLNENYFEVELTDDGSCNVYIIKDKQVLLIRNHLGDHKALHAGKNKEYDPEIITCYKALMKYIFRYMHHFDESLKRKINSKDYCFEIIDNHPTKFHFKADEKYFDIREVICKYFQYISASVSKITNKNERSFIVSSSIKYDIFKNPILLDAIKMTGYSLHGQLVYDTRGVPKSETEDKLEMLFAKMRRLLGKNDLFDEESEKDLLAPNLSKNDKDETFSLEILKHNKVKVCATINKKFFEIKNHIGDMHALKKIHNRIEDNNIAENMLDREDIEKFKKLVKFAFEHLSKACTEQEALKFNSIQMKIVAKNPIKFTLENCKIEYTMEDFFVKYFKFMSKSVSRKTKKSANKVLLTVPTNFNILQKTQLKTYIEKAQITCVKIQATQTMKILSLECERKFTKPGLYILIDMNTNLEDLDGEETKVTLDIKRHRKFKILSTLIENKLDANELEAKFESLLVDNLSKFKQIFEEDADSLKNYSNKLQEQFILGKSRAEIRIDDVETIRVDLKTIENLLAEYAEQANTLLNVCLEENKLSLDSDIIRVDYTCRIFSRIFGKYLENKNQNSKSKFNCIDGYNTYNILEYLNQFNDDNVESVSTNLNHNIGFSIAGGIFDIHLKRNEHLPCKSTKQYITAFDYQTELLFPMFMGERPLIRYCESLGQVKVKNIPKARAGEVSIELTLYVDEDEKLTVSATENKHNKALPVEFQFNETYESKGVQLLLDAIRFKVEDTEVQKIVATFKNTVKDVRIKYQHDYLIREEMNAFMSRLNKLKEEIDLQSMNLLLKDLEERIQELKIKKE